MRADLAQAHAFAFGEAAQGFLQRRNAPVRHVRSAARRRTKRAWVSSSANWVRVFSASSSGRAFSANDHRVGQLQRRLGAVADERDRALDQDRVTLAQLHVAAFQDAGPPARPAARARPGGCSGC